MATVDGLRVDVNIQVDTPLGAASRRGVRDMASLLTKTDKDALLTIFNKVVNALDAEFGSAYRIEAVHLDVGE